MILYIFNSYLLAFGPRNFFCLFCFFFSLLFFSLLSLCKEMDRNGVPFIIPGMKYRDVIGGALDVGQGIIAPDPRSKLRAFNRNLIRSGKYVGKANDAIAN